MVPIPGMGNVEGGSTIRALLTEFLRGFSLRTLIFLLDMVLPQLDAYHSGRQLQHLQPWVSVELAQQLDRGQPGSAKCHVSISSLCWLSCHAVAY